MKIAIPTNDGINVAPDFEIAKGCLIVTVSLGEIVHEDLRWKTENNGVSPAEICSAITDCSLIIVRKLEQSSIRILRAKNFTVLYTADEIITNAIVHYLEREYREASNTCCCP